MKPQFYRRPVMGGRTQALIVRGWASEDGATETELVLTVVTGSDGKLVRRDIDNLAAALNRVMTERREGKL